MSSSIIGAGPTHTHTEEVKVVLTACRPIERELCGKNDGKNLVREGEKERE
jgi:hypothetical protein